MKNLKNKLISRFPEKDYHDIELYNKYLHKKLFRGFYYDSDDKSYGIVISFSQNQNNSLNLFAQESKAGTILVEYKINCSSFNIEQLAYDKVMITASACKKQPIIPGDKNITIPKVVEFSIQVLSRNSIYLRFINHELFSPPISSFQGGLVLSLDNQHISEDFSEIEVEAGGWF